ncbi:MAG: hypothetical protein ACFFCW_03425 [Candidatus Hodarchaeota archaeon]
MRIQFVLTPTESKKLISKAVVTIDSFKHALDKGTIVIHPSSTTVFILSELGYQLEPSELWICGLTIQRGLCASAEILQEVRKAGKFDPKEYSHSWIIKKGKLTRGLQLKDVLPLLAKGDLYIKSPNSIDPNGKVGVLFSAKGAGTIGMVKKAQRKQGFEIILPTGLEKLVPKPIEEICRKSPKHGMNFCTGTPCGVIPVEGSVITELEAIRILSGAESIPIASGGVGGAEGALVLVVRGDEQQIKKVSEVLGGVKEASLPILNLLECSECKRTTCHLSPVFDFSHLPKDGWMVPEAYEMKVRKH